MPAKQRAADLTDDAVHDAMIVRNGDGAGQARGHCIGFVPGCVGQGRVDGVAQNDDAVAIQNPGRARVVRVDGQVRQGRGVGAKRLADVVIGTRVEELAQHRTGDAPIDAHGGIMQQCRDGTQDHLQRFGITQ